MFFGLNELKYCEDFCIYIKSLKFWLCGDLVGLVCDR